MALPLALVDHHQTVPIIRFGPFPKGLNRISHCCGPSDIRQSRNLPWRVWLSTEKRKVSPRRLHISCIAGKVPPKKEKPYSNDP